MRRFEFSETFLNIIYQLQNESDGEIDLKELAKRINSEEKTCTEVMRLIVLAQSLPPIKKDISKKVMFYVDTTPAKKI
jgi:hypothetical protein